MRFWNIRTALVGEAAFAQDEIGASEGRGNSTFSVHSIFFAKLPGIQGRKNVPQNDLGTYLAIEQGLRF